MMTGANALNHGSADLPDGYRLTGLGSLPEEWRVVRLGETFEIQQGKALSPEVCGKPPSRAACHGGILHLRL
jgi:hypothetical protein